MRNRTAFSINLANELCIMLESLLLQVPNKLMCMSCTECISQEHLPNENRLHHT